MKRLTIFGKMFGCIVPLFWGFVLIAYFINIYQLFQCDFDSKTSWKPEVIHLVGIFIPPAAPITIFFDAG